MVECLLVGLGGFLGSVARYLLGLLPLKAFGSFPVKTLAINVLGAFALSVIVALAAKGKELDPRLVLMLKTGICGGFTTFSTFAYEAFELAQGGHAGLSALYMALSMALGLGAVWLGQLLAA